MIKVSRNNSTFTEADGTGTNEGIGDKINNKLSYANSKLNSIDDTISGQKVDSRSIVARTKNSIIQFPIYISNTNRINAAHLISGLFERYYASLFQNSLALNPIIDEKDVNNVAFLKQFHTNIKEAVDVLVNKYYEPIDDMDSVIQESIHNEIKINDNLTLEFSIIPCTNDVLIQENARLIHEPFEGLGYIKEKNNNIKEKNNNRVNNGDRIEQSEDITRSKESISENEFRNMAIETLIASGEMTSSDRSILNKSLADLEREVRIEQNDLKGDVSDPTIVAQKVEEKMNQQKDLEYKISQEIDSLKSKIRNGSKNGFRGIVYDNNGHYIRYNSTTKNVSKNVSVYARATDVPVMLRDTDVKKINGLLPYNFEATFAVKDSNGNINRDVKFIIGVKSVLHLIRPQDLADDLRELIMGNIRTLQKVRYKTGEINFLDYIFNLKQLKNDAGKNINYNKRWINNLKRLAEYNKMNGSLMKTPIELINKGEIPIPNGTLILTQSDVSMLMNQTGIDLSKVGNVKKLSKSLFLMAFAIVDSAAGTMRILFDQDSDWDVQSLASLDAELSKSDNSSLLKELNGIINR